MGGPTEAYYCPACGSDVVVPGYFADTFGKECTCSKCGTVCEVEHEYGDDACMTYLVRK